MEFAGEFSLCLSVLPYTFCIFPAVFLETVARDYSTVFLVVDPSVVPSIACPFDRDDGVPGPRQMAFLSLFWP